MVYYTSTETSALDRNVYSIKLDGTGKKLLSSQKGTNKAEFSTTFKYFINTWSDANTPAKVTLHDASGRLIRVLEDNAELQKMVAENGFGKKEFITVPTANDLQLNGYMIKPLNFDPGKRYPVLVYVYGGPESQEVTNSWDTSMGWFQMIVQQGYLVVCIDNRGTDGRGENFKKCTYLQLGKLETEDQINAARFLATLPYIDGNRIGIFGWSYGGYMTSLCMTKGAGIFKLGIAVAPVTNWRFYDSIYTERFMRTPQENPTGYDDNSPINFADMLKGKLLLIHGSADDNVHLQNTMVFARKLVQAGKSFDMAIYPDKNHSLPGKTTRLHLYQKMTDFLLGNL
jgi:dipeptidyl-peptidase-4